MAEQGAIEFGSAATVSYDDRLQTYTGFLRLVKYSVTGIIILLVLMAIFLL